MLAEITGDVLQGKKQGRTLGFPTANLELTADLSGGIYRGWVVIEGEKHPAGIYIPNEQGETKIIEAHILDFDNDIYGHEITIVVEAKIRNSKKVTDEEELRALIAKDIAVVRQLWQM